MKVAFTSSAWRKRLLILAGTGSLLFLAAHPCPAASGDASDAALVAANAWIALIDAGKYIESYEAGCAEFHQKVEQSKWVLVLKAFRPAYGKVVSRRETSHVIQENGINGLDGECVVITYDTSFSRLPDGFEQVILKLENGKWRGAAYQAGPKASSEPATNLPPPQVQTEVQSMKTAHPQQ